MPELENRIAEWRARMEAALPQRDEAVAELEEHLREHLANLHRQGKSDDEALALAQERLGEPQAVAREFDRMPVGWPPALILLPALAVALAFLVGFTLWHGSRNPITALHVVYFVFLATYITGSFGVLGSGLIATSAFITTLWRPLRELERCAVRQLLKKLARFAVVWVAVGTAFHILWRAQPVFIHGSSNWEFLRLTGPLVSAVLLFFAQSRSPVSDRVRWLTSIFASCAVFFSMFGTRIRVVDIPVASLCAVFLVGQVFLVLPRFRIVRVR